MPWDILGHEWAARLLQEHVAQNRIRHAYLFTGPTGVGRRTLALRLAQAANCPNPPAPGQPCGECSTCKRIEQMQHPDLSVVQSGQEGGMIKVDQVRELQHTLSLSPYEARYRVALLLRFEEANPNAANALLKTLEEPNPQVILLLTAESAESLLPTIASRCEIIRLRPMALEALSQGLQERWALTAERARLIAHLAGGRPGYARALVQQPERIEQRQAYIEDLSRLLKSPRLERFNYAETLSKDKDQARQVLQVWLSFWRDILLQTTHTTNPLANLDRSEEIRLLAERLDREGVRRSIAAIQRTLSLLERNINARLAVEVLMLHIPRM